MGDGGSRKKALRRSHLRKFSSTVVGGTSSIDKHYFREHAQRAHALSHRDIAFMKLFGLEPTAANQRARMERGEREPFLVETPRDRVLKDLDKMLNGVDPLKNVCLIPNTFYMFWDGHGYCFFVKVNHIEMSCKRSCRYGSRELAMLAFNTSSVRWK